MSFKVIFNNKEKIYDAPITVLDVVGKDRSIICAYVNGRVRELTYTLDKDSEIVPLTCKDRDAKPIYEASLRFFVDMKADLMQNSVLSETHRQILNLQKSWLFI